MNTFKILLLSLLCSANMANTTQAAGHEFQFTPEHYDGKAYNFDNDEKQENNQPDNNHAINPKKRCSNAEYHFESPEYQSKLKKVKFDHNEGFRDFINGGFDYKPAQLPSQTDVILKALSEIAQLFSNDNEVKAQNYNEVRFNLHYSIHQFIAAAQEASANDATPHQFDTEARRLLLLLQRAQEFIKIYPNGNLKNLTIALFALGEKIQEKMTITESVDGDGLFVKRQLKMVIEMEDLLPFIQRMQELHVSFNGLDELVQLFKQQQI